MENWCRQCFCCLSIVVETEPAKSVHCGEIRAPPETHWSPSNVESTITSGTGEDQKCTGKQVSGRNAWVCLRWERDRELGKLGRERESFRVLKCMCVNCCDTTGIFICKINYSYAIWRHRCTASYALHDSFKWTLECDLVNLFMPQTERSQTKSKI